MFDILFPFFVLSILVIILLALRVKAYSIMYRETKDSLRKVKSETHSLEIELYDVKCKNTELNDTLLYSSNNKLIVGSKLTIVQDPLNRIRFIEGIIGETFIIQSVDMTNGRHKIKRISDGHVFNADHSDIRCYLWDCSSGGLLKHNFI